MQTALSSGAPALAWACLAGAAVLLACWLLWRRRRRSKRMHRRSRRIAHQHAWNWLMRRQAQRRLTDQRTTAAD
jgi:uncharacterized iron-regulated membrane protein